MIVEGVEVGSQGGGVKAGAAPEGQGNEGVVERGGRSAAGPSAGRRDSIGDCSLDTRGVGAES